MDYIDDQVESVNEWEARQVRAAQQPVSTGRSSNKILVGKVDQFFDKIGVAAITLTSGLKVGDIIEIGNDEDAVRQRISSMQIEHEDVNEASDGSSIGVKLKYKVTAGSDVYRIE